MVACHAFYGRYAEKQWRSDTCRIRLLLVGQIDFQSMVINRLGDSEDSGGNVGVTEFLKAI